MNSLAFFKNLEKKLTRLYDAPENAEIAFWLIEHHTGLKKTDIFLDKMLPFFDQTRFESDLERLLRAEPIQYVVGQAEFFGRKFKVNPNVLIPRPETEILVGKIIEENRPQTQLQILDIGTGSGCIPITLSLELPHNQIFSWDISAEALAVAAENAQNLGAKVSFEQQDILAYPHFPERQFDLIVSNPPYVVEFEKAEMRQNVLAYEPALALFVPDHDPFLFYTALAAFALLHLKEGGKFYLEINERYGENLKEMYEDCGFRDVQVEKDWAGKDRFLVGKK